ncbi:envelope stress response membrane protein PspB [Sphingomonas glacialis]|uniref:Envelope stress response membrane protein PspB n=1 Tax=Sphingomonas glacialis TaxID=658225 RepID=A0A502FI37_9SPHN|nr:envelope stress response membrane protein PspB [Sphingomonas glacialis]TPG49108.1 envelope stress response membrane protein PspB [Sphingomonas glacialis]
MDDSFLAIPIVAILFVGLPWVILHYVTKWKQAPKITNEDEKLLDELYTLARRLEDRLGTVERIVAADHPEWRASMPLAEPNPTQYDITRRN